MKHIISISLGSSSRDKSSHTVLLGEEYLIERVGVDGNMDLFARKMSEMDGRVDAIGLGGIDLYLWTEKRRYTIKDAAKLASYAKQTPVLDGSGIKNTIERMTLEYLKDNKIIDFDKSKVLMVCALDRFGMAQTFRKLCQPKQVIYGDFMFVLGLNWPLYNYYAFTRIVESILPVFCRIPFKYLYPTGDKQNKTEEKFNKEYSWADIIAGDFHFINKYLPSIESGALENKIIITNTLTQKDIENLKDHNVKMIISTTPSFEGRNFGTNVFEGILTCMLGKNVNDASKEEVNTILEKLNWKPTIVYSRGE